MITAFNHSDSSSFAEASAAFLELFDDLDAMMGTAEPYLLGQWLQRADSWGTEPSESADLRANALLQVTTWGPNTMANGLHEVCAVLSVFPSHPP